MNIHHHGRRATPLLATIYAIRRPLGIESSYDPVHVVTALNYQIKTAKKIGGAKELASGYQIVVTDAGAQAFFTERAPKDSL